MRFNSGPGGAADPDGMSTITGLPGSADRAGEFTLNVPAAEELPGVRLGRYEVFDEAARGGMGVVYRAADTLFGRYVAVKVLRAGLAGDRHAARRLADEARITAQLQHPGVPPIYDLGTLPDGRPYLVTELIRGSNLDELLRDAVAVPPRDELVGVFERVCEAVAYAHRERVVHRDLKPHNVMIGAFGEVKVLDWGLAKVLPAGRPGGVRLPPADGSGATAPGAVLGTPNYMPPEQAAGEVELTDERADVFGLGAILCFILTGQPPFTADTAGEARLAALRGAVGEAFTRLSRCGADPELVALCKRCLAPDPADRPRDGGEVVAAVRAYRAAAEHLGRAEDLIRASVDGERRVTGLLEAEVRRRRWVEAALAAALGLLFAVAGWAILLRR